MPETRFLRNEPIFLKMRGELGSTKRDIALSVVSAQGPEGERKARHILMK